MKRKYLTAALPTTKKRGVITGGRKEFTTLCYGGSHNKLHGRKGGAVAYERLVGNL